MSGRPCPRDVGIPGHRDDARHPLDVQDWPFFKPFWNINTDAPCTFLGFPRQVYVFHSNAGCQTKRLTMHKYQPGDIPIAGWSLPGSGQDNQSKGLVRWLDLGMGLDKQPGTQDVS